VGGARPTREKEPELYSLRQKDQGKGGGGGSRRFGAPRKKKEGEKNPHSSILSGIDKKQKSKESMERGKRTANRTASVVALAEIAGQGRRK